MRQLVIPHFGPPEVLEVREAPEPRVEPGTVRIRVHAAGVNFSDLLARQGLYPDAPKPPCTIGYEVAGAVDAVGEGVTTIRRGDLVIATTRFGPLTLMNDNRSVAGVNLGHLWKERTLLEPQIAALVDYAREGKLMPRVDRAFPLAEAAAAHRYIHERRNVGKVVLTFD